MTADAMPSLLSREPGEPWDEDLPDPDTAPPAGYGWMSPLPPELQDAELDPACAPGMPEAPHLGLMAPISRHGAGFSVGGAAGKLEPGPVLAGLADREWADGLDRVSDNALIGLACAWRRLASWATAGEAAAVAELNRRRLAQVAAGADPHLAEHVGDEIAVPLTLTMRGADLLLDFACRLDELPLTKAALAAGDIDRAKASVIADELSGLNPAHAAAVEAAIIPRAPGQTTAQLRRSARQGVLAVDPAAARTRREKAQKEARVEIWDERAGTAALAGRDLPPADVLAADKHINSLAHQLRAAGAEGNLDQLRARAYTGLLAGYSPGAIVAQAAAATAAQEREGGSSPAAQRPAAANPAADRQPPVARPPAGGSVNLTLPLASLFDDAGAPGEVAGFGPVSAADAQALAWRLAGQPARWCLTLTSPDGRAFAHGCARLTADTGESVPGQAFPGGDWEMSVTIKPLAAAVCTHQRETGGYRPSPSLRHLIQVRHRTCAYPGCGRPASQCDLDHTIPFGQGGRTCECNLASLCRRHHRAKQVQGWQLEQRQPGIVTWKLPHGRTYDVKPPPLPGDGSSAGPGP